MDLAPVARGTANFLSGDWTLQGVSNAIGPYSSWLIVGALLAALFLTGIGRRVRRVVEELFFSNWQLALLASTAIALSLASGYTTFDGMRNFTNAPLLSLAITFGIQGVMLIVAWLIGESFATGMSTVARRGYGRAAVPLVLIAGAAALVCVVAAAGIYAVRYGIEPDTVMKGFVAVAIALLAVVLLMLFSKSDVLAPYGQAMRIIARTSVLWVMFLSTMTASVFFSFDSHFNAIFPPEARARAAEIRTTSQIGGVIADIGAQAQRRQIEEAERLFETPGWKAYDQQLTKLAQASAGAQKEIETYYNQRIEERNRAIREQQQRIETAQGGQAGLASKKISLTEELSRLKGERPGLAAQYGQARADVETKIKEIDAKRVEALAEDRGVEGTMKQGRGPAYRQRMGELGVLRDQLEVLEERANNAKKRLNAAESRIAEVERELASVDGDLAQLQAEAATAEQRIKLVQSAGGDPGAKLDPVRVLPTFERARAAFRQSPDTQHLAALQLQCTNLLNAMSSTEATKERVRAIDCDPKQAAEAAARVFALNAGLVAFRANCAGGDKLAQHTTTDALLAFGRKCLQDSGLVGDDLAAIGTRLSAVDMNRDDKAHRFVVTWNAFLDGNRLAYLALVLAIGVDAMVFMAGLFGANAIRSPLSDVPSLKPRSAEQLEAIVKNALGEDRLENAELALAAMKPVHDESGYHAEVDLSTYDYETARRIRKVLVAGSSIGAVIRATADRHERYLVRSELFEYLSVVANSARESDSEYAHRSKLIQIVGVALEPDRATNADTVLHYVEPINQKNGFMAKVDLHSVDAANRRLVQNVLNAGMTLNAVHRHDTGGERRRRIGRLLHRQEAAATSYLIRSELFKTLLLYRAGSSALGAGRPASAPASLGTGDKPMLDDRSADREVAPQLTHRPPQQTEDDLDLAAQFWDDLLGTIGLDQKAAARLLHNDVRVPAASAWEALRKLSQGNLRLRRYLDEIESAKREAIAQRYGELRYDHDGQPRALEALEEVNEDLEGMLKSLLLLPEVAVTQELIDKLEAAAQHDNGQAQGEQELLERLRAVHREIARIDQSSADAWKHVTHIIDGERGEARTIDIMNPVNKRAI